MAISINGVTVAGVGKNGTDGKDATVNGVNALNIEATGGIIGQQSGDTYTIDGSGLLSKAGGEMAGEIRVKKSTSDDDFSIQDKDGYSGLSFYDGRVFITSHGSSGMGEVKLATELGSVSVDGANIYVYSSAGAVNISSGLDGVFISDVVDPTDEKDAANKKYVDDLVGSINTLLDTLNGEVI